MTDDKKQEREVRHGCEEPALAEQFIDFIDETDWELSAWVRENADVILAALRQPRTDALKVAREARGHIITAATGAKNAQVQRYRNTDIEADPLVEVMKQAGWADAVIESCAPSLSAALDARGLEIREKK
jgi:hypothetical protein